MARDCPEAGGNDNRDQGGAYKRPRRDDDGGFQASNENAWGTSNQQENGWGAASDSKW